MRITSISGLDSVAMQPLLASAISPVPPAAPKPKPSESAPKAVAPPAAVNSGVDLHL